MTSFDADSVPTVPKCARRLGSHRVLHQHRPSSNAHRAFQAEVRGRWKVTCRVLPGAPSSTSVASVCPVHPTGGAKFSTVAAALALVVGAALLTMGVWANLQQRHLTMQVVKVDAPGAEPLPATVEVACGSKVAPVSDPVPTGCGEHLASLGFTTVAIPWIGFLLVVVGGGALVVGQLSHRKASMTPRAPSRSGTAGA
jgi:hypothetical protein